MKITKTSHPQIVKIARHAFPMYTGRKFRLEYVARLDCSNESGAMGGGGTQSDYRFVRLDNGAMLTVSPVGLGESWTGRTAEMMEGLAAVEHSYFCGQDMGLTVYLKPQLAIAA